MGVENLVRRGAVVVMGALSILLPLSLSETWFQGGILKSGVKHMPQNYTVLRELLYVHRNSHQILVERELWRYSFLHYQ